MKLYLILLLCILGAAATCQKADYCGSTLCACNGACYSEDQYCCPNGQLTQKAFCASSPAASSSSAAAASSAAASQSSAAPAATSTSSATCQKADYCSPTHCACNGACYSEDQYCCSNGQLTQKAFCASSPAASSSAAAASSAAATSSAAAASSTASSSCQEYSIVPISSCADSNPAKDYQCCTSDGYGLTNGSFCGTRHQCYNGYCGLTGRLGENCAAPSTSSSSSSCQTSSYCPSTLCSCNGACYSEDNYCCSNGQLTQKSFCSASSSGSANSASAVQYSQYMAADISSVSTLTLINNCDVTISLCSTYGGPLFDLAAGQNATNQPSGPYNECGSVQAEVTLTASNSQSCYDLSEVAYKQSKHPITLYSSNGNTLNCETSPCSDATQQGGSPQVKCVAAPTNIVIQWC